ncbi:phage tail tape measure protein [Gluconobacter morbifer]|uniref:Uncharacterized protein n=1 Tax=Gluconobacter morbifer G707 TaxID=1088869 RepID=G6XIR9_9PROT|nr:hypothetical protein [Gluconobacter morbifer]EHH68377.1 hypothetical protein GMO_11470 [Gluconobacter morbifer G707]
MAGGKGFSVTITAVDKVTKTLDDITKKTRETFQPFRNLYASVNRLSQVSGLNQVGNSLRDVGRGARDVFDRVSSIVAPLGAITGAASLAGMYRMVAAWSQWGSQLRFASQGIGVSTQRLSSWEAAAQIAGASAGTMTSALRGLGQNMYDAVGGRNASFVALMNGWHIAFRKTALEGRNASEVFPKIAERIAALKDPFAQSQAAAIAFGGAGEALLPFLRRGAQGMRDYQREAERYLHVTPQTTAAADAFRMAQTRLTLAVQGLGNRISERLSPTLTPLLNQFAEWLATSPQVTTAVNTLGTAVEQFASWVRAINWQSVGHELQIWGQRISALTGLVGGPENALKGLVAFMTGSMLLKMAAPWTHLALAIGRVGLTIAQVAGVFTPQGLLISTSAALIGAGALGIYKHWAGISQFFSNMWANVRASFDDAWEHISHTIDLFRNSWIGHAVGGIARGMSRAAHAVMGLASPGVPYQAGTLLKDTGANQQQYQTFARSVAGIEGARYDQMGGSSGRFAGRYQMGSQEISEAARYLGVQEPTRQQFLGNPGMQEQFFEAYTDMHARYLSQHSAAYRNASPQEKLSILGYAHNQGAGGAAKWLETGRAGHDAYGTSGTRYSDSVSLNLSRRPSGETVNITPSSGTTAGASGSMTIQVQAAPGTHASVLSKEGAIHDARVVHNNVTGVMA